MKVIVYSPQYQGRFTKKWYTTWRTINKDIAEKEINGLVCDFGGKRVRLLISEENIDEVRS